MKAQPRGVQSIDSSTCGALSSSLRILPGWQNRLVSLAIVQPPNSVRLRVIPLALTDANRLVSLWHRHHKPVVGHRFSLGVRTLDAPELIGAVIVGRPVAKAYDQNIGCEVTRLVTNGTVNTCSFLYGAAARVARAMGFDWIQTYTLSEESGVSLRAAGWDCLEVSVGGQWQHSGQRQLRLDAYADGVVSGNRTDQPTGPKRRWRKTFRTEAPG